jgi:hypothetical protein
MVACFNGTLSTCFNGDGSMRFSKLEKRCLNPAGQSRFLCQIRYARKDKKEKQKK